MHNAAEVMDEARKYAPVLDRMVTILGSESGVTFGVAMARASSELGLKVPEHMVMPLMVSAFKVISTGRIPGAPDA